MSYSKLFFVIMAICMVTISCKSKIDKIVDNMTLEEKVDLLVGAGNESRWVNDSVNNVLKLLPGVAGCTTPFERFGIPAIYLCDGPAGVNIEPTREGDDATYYCTHFPIGTLLSSTWNDELVQNVGNAIGEEAVSYGADVVLGPGMNIHRHPLNGRNFEYYSEDPVLTGKIAAAYIRGIQQQGVGACPKHFAANNQETNRMSNDARVSERALREIYYKGFEIAVKEGNPKCLMTSYNKINGVSVSEHRDICTDMLRGEWGFDGVVMSDWYGGDHPDQQIWAGNDLLQPGLTWQKDSILAAVKDGRLDEEHINTSVRRILNLVFNSPRGKGMVPNNKPDLDAHAAITRQSASEGSILLKNDNQTLPFSSSVKNIALFGCDSYDFIPGGSGSGEVRCAYTVSMLEGLQNAGYSVDPVLASQYAAFIEKSKAANTAAVTPRFAELTRIRPDEMPLSESDISAQQARSDMAIITLGRTSGEYYDRPSADFRLSDAELAMVQDVCRIFHAAGKKVVVVLNICGVIETSSWKHLPDAILCVWLPGQEGGNSVADLLSGKENPSGKLPMTFPIDFVDHASNVNFPVDQKSENVSVVLRRKDIGERNVDYTNYDEGIFVGYRWFDTRNVEVSYPFGFGLSYTTFDYSDIEVVEKRDKVTVSVKVTNTGKVSGKEVVQLYVGAPQNVVEKPVKELKAYAKTSLLEPGKSTFVKLTFNKQDLASFCEKDNKWVVDNGSYKLMVGASSRDIRFTSDFAVTK